MLIITPNRAANPHLELPLPPRLNTQLDTASTPCVTFFTIMLAAIVISLFVIRAM
jgi:hypothetical protein